VLVIGYGAHELTKEERIAASFLKEKIGKKIYLLAVLAAKTILDYPFNICKHEIPKLQGECMYLLFVQQVIQSNLS
jgi:hypothetical protein